jgi:hypothetical protein
VQEDEEEAAEAGEEEAAAEAKVAAAEEEEAAGAVKEEEEEGARAAEEERKATFSRMRFGGGAVSDRGGGRLGDALSRTAVGCGVAPATFRSPCFFVCCLQLKDEREREMKG